MRGAVAAGNAQTVAAGMAALAQGGNAVDAVVAATLMACVTEPLLTGLGGGGLAMVRMAGQTQVLDFFGTMPGLCGKAHGTMRAVDVDFGPVRQRFLAGPASACVPGMPQGIWELHQRYGVLPMPLLAQDAVRACSEGVPVTHATQLSAGLLWEILQMTPLSESLFGRDDDQGGRRPLQEGDTFYNPALGPTLVRLAQEGPAFLVTGQGAGAMLRTLGPESALGMRDLAAYRALWSPALSAAYRGVQVHMPGAPSQGGFQVQHALQALGKSKRAAFSAQEIVDVARAMDAAERAMPKDRVALFGHGFGAKYLGSGYTTHTSVVDEAGNAVSITSSLGETSGWVVPETGVVTNNFLGEADVNPPGHPRPPGERLLTMCTPTLVQRGEEIIAMGAGGSSRIRSAVLHGVLYAVDHHSLPSKISGRPRLHMEDGQLRLETFERAPEVLQAVGREWGEFISFPEYSMYMGGLHVAGKWAGGLSAGGDPRRSGSAASS